MVSDEPLPDRCAGRVSDKVGLEISLDVSIGNDSAGNGGENESESESETEDDTVVVTDMDIDVVRLLSPSGELTIDAEPNYEDVRKYLWEDYEPTLLGVLETTDPTLGTLHIETVRDPTAPDTDVGGHPLTDDHRSIDDATWIDVGDHIVNVTNRTSEHRGYCERYPLTDADHGRCRDHAPGTGAPKGNTNRLEHGLYAQRTNFYKILEAEDKAFIDALVDSWIEQSPYGRDNVAVVNELYRCAIDQLRA